MSLDNGASTGEEPINAKSIYSEISTLTAKNTSDNIKIDTGIADAPVALNGLGLPMGARTGAVVAKGTVDGAGKLRRGTLISEITVHFPPD